MQPPHSACILPIAREFARPPPPDRLSLPEGEWEGPQSWGSHSQTRVSGAGRGGLGEVPARRDPGEKAPLWAGSPCPRIRPEAQQESTGHENGAEVATVTGGSLGRIAGAWEQDAQQKHRSQNRRNKTKIF